jgi:hypothetical protein
MSAAWQDRPRSGSGARTRTLQLSRLAPERAKRFCCAARRARATPSSPAKCTLRRRRSPCSWSSEERHVAAEPPATRGTAAITACLLRAAPLRTGRQRGGRGPWLLLSAASTIVLDWRAWLQSQAQLRRKPDTKALEYPSNTPRLGPGVVSTAAVDAPAAFTVHNVGGPMPGDHTNEADSWTLRLGAAPT